MSSEFTEEILIDKLAKLNNTQQSIENLSQWCIVHRNEAELVVTTWEKQFHSTEMAQKVRLLYLANDILQNSKRQGNEFVQGFWNVLPKAVKDIVSQGDDRGKCVVSRLVSIWEERRVFGSRSKSLNDVMLSEEAPPPLELEISKKRSRGSKSAKQASKSAKTKSFSGGVTEKIIYAYNLVTGENSNEDTEVSKCKSAVKRIKRMEKDVEDACSTGNDLRRKTLAKELEEEENILKKSVEKLKSIEESRTSLLSHLREALREQESKLENLQSQIQAAEEQTKAAQNMQNRLNGETPSPADNNNGTSGQSTRVTPASVAAMAERLTSSTNSSMIMHSVLSSIAAEATQTAGLSTSNGYAPPNPQYHMIPNAAALQSVIPYGYGNIPLLHHGQLPPRPGMVPAQSGMVPRLMMSNQPNVAQQQQQQQQQQGQSFQLPPGVVYFGPPPHHS